MMRSPKAAHASKSLSYEDSYTCPVCRHGQISGLTLMDAFACNFCHHIFTANLQAQSVQVVDSSQTLSWRWNGQTWRPLHQRQWELTWLVWLTGLVLIVLPPTLTGLAAYLFPPLDTRSWQFPWLWTGLTFSLHFLLVAWLLTEHYQWSVYVTLKVRLRQWFRQR